MQELITPKTIWSREWRDPSCNIDNNSVTDPTTILPVFLNISSSLLRYQSQFQFTAACPWLEVCWFCGHSLGIFTLNLMWVGVPIYLTTVSKVSLFPSYIWALLHLPYKLGQNCLTLNIHATSQQASIPTLQLTLFLRLLTPRFNRRAASSREELN